MRIPGLRIVGLALVMGAAACAQVKPVTEVAKQHWVEARTANFIVVTDAGKARARSMIADLEDFRRFAISALDMKIEAAPLPFTIIAVTSESDLQSLVESAGVFGVFHTTYHGGLAVVNINARGPDGTDDLQITYTPAGPIYRTKQNMHTIGMDGVYHEYVHYLQAMDQHHRYPLWYSEGFADYLSTLDVASDGKYRVGAPPMHRVRELQDDRMTWIPLGALLNADSYENGHDDGTFYGESWLLTHYLLSNPKRKALLNAYLAASDHPTVDPASLFEKVFGMTTEQLGARLRQYLRSNRFLTEHVARSSAPLPVPVVSDVAPDEIRTRLGFALLHFTTAYNKAEVLLKEALAINPRNLRARILLAALAFARGDDARVQKFIDGAGPDANADPEFLTLKGHVAVRQAVKAFMAKSNKWQDDIARARQLFTAAIKLDPDAAEPRLGLGRSYLLYEGPPPVIAVEAVERARQLIPSDYDAYLLLGHLHLRRGEVAAAKRNYERVIAWSRDPEARRRAREMMDEIKAIEAEYSEKSADAVP